MLGAIVGAGVLAAVGAVNAASGGSAKPIAVSEVVPKSVFDELKFMDQQLTKAIAEAGKGEAVRPRIDNIKKAKFQLIDSQFGDLVDGVKGSTWFRELDCVDVQLRLAQTYETLSNAEHFKQFLEKDIPGFLENAQKCKEKLETALGKANQPEKVSITESDTWAHNASIGKSNICINVKTTPPQAFISAGLAGPGNYTASLPKTPLHSDGTRQVGATITEAGSYTDTLRVYDKSGTQTATTTHTFTVAPPPQDGPDPAFGPSCPAPTK